MEVNSGINIKDYSIYDKILILLMKFLRGKEKVLKT